MGLLHLVLTGCAVVAAPPARAQEMPTDYAAFAETVEGTGDFKDGVFKVRIPRNDLRVTIL